LPDFRVADTAPEHPKLRAAGLAAAGLWSLAGAYAMNPAHMTDGWVPLHWVQTWPSGKKHAAKLVEVGLWREETRNGLAGYRFHDWSDSQRSSSKVEDDRRKARERMKRLREGDVRANKPEPVRANNGSTFAETDTERNAERSPNVRDALHPHPLPKGEGETPKAAQAGIARDTRGRGATGPNSANAFRLVDKTLGRELTSGTRTALAIEVATLLAEVDEPTLIAALERWNSRTEIGPKLLGALVDDIRKERRGATNRRTSSGADRPSTTDQRVAAAQALKARFATDGATVLQLPSGNPR
jgi:hypothetical protein